MVRSGVVRIDAELMTERSAEFPARPVCTTTFLEGGRGGLERVVEASRLVAAPDRRSEVALAGQSGPSSIGQSLEAMRWSIACAGARPHARDLARSMVRLGSSSGLRAIDWSGLGAIPQRRM